MPIIVQQDATIYSLFISVNRSTCFGWYLHPSSGIHVTVSTATVISKTVIATCRERDWKGPPHTTSWRFILILSSHLRLGLPSVLFPSEFPTKTLHTPLLSPIRATCSAQFILLDFITRTILGEEYRSFSSSLCSFLHSPVTSSLLGPNTYFPQHLFLRHPQPAFLPQCQRPSFKPIQKTGRITVLYILLFKCLDRKLDDKTFRTE